VQSRPRSKSYSWLAAELAALRELTALREQAALTALRELPAALTAALPAEPHLQKALPVGPRNYPLSVAPPYVLFLPYVKKVNPIRIRFTFLKTH
jgi:hypothetical protein